MIGASIAGIVAVLVALVDQGPLDAALMLGGVILVQQIEGHVLQPFLLGRWVRMHPLGVIVAIAGGVLVAGIVGALVAVPVAAAANAVVLHLAELAAWTAGLREEVVPMAERFGLSDIEAARPHGRSSAVLTPMIESRWLSRVTGGEVWLKCENLQRTGSFKIRGASVRLARLSRGGAGSRSGRGLRRQPRPGRRAGGAAARDRGDGLHARRARRSRRSGATRGYGAEVRLVPGTRRGRAGRGARGGRARPARCSSTRSTTPTSSPGRARSGWRSSSSARTSGTVLVPTGGGGLIAGVAVAIKALRPDVRVVGVQAAGAAAFPASLAAGQAGRARRDERRWPTASPSASPAT